MYNLIEDLSCITNIKKYNLDMLIDNIQSLISHSIVESVLNKEKIVQLDIGIGYLYISNESNIIKYKFIPSKKLEDIVLNSYQNNDRLEIKIEKSLNSRISKSYKELF